MAFIDDLNSAKRFHFPNVPIGRYSSIDDFYTAIVKDNEIKPEVLKGWTELLYRYVDNDAAIVFVRKLEKNERRGFRTIFENGFSYVFSDNTLATVIYAMAKQDIVPSDEEFYDYIRSRRAMPLSLMLHGVERSEFCAFPYYGHPRQNGWKLAHINDINNAGEYVIDYEQFQHVYFLKGDLSDWELDPREGPVRRFYYNAGRLTPQDREIFAAHFLRFCNPLNYFLVPNSNSHEILINGVNFGHGIGEYNAMKRYVDQERKKVFGSMYEDYLKKILSAGIDEAAAAEIEVLTYPKNNRSACAPLKDRASNLKKSVMERDDNKVVRRLIRWAENPNSKPYRIIRAFLSCCDGHFVAEIADMKRLCGNDIIHPDMFVAAFDGCFASLKTNSGNSYGLVFVQTDTHVSLHPAVRDNVVELRDLFIS